MRSRWQLSNQLQCCIDITPVLHDGLQQALQEAADCQILLLCQHLLHVFQHRVFALVQGFGPEVSLVTAFSLHKHQHCIRCLMQGRCFHWQLKKFKNNQACVLPQAILPLLPMQPCNTHLPKVLGYTIMQHQSHSNQLGTEMEGAASMWYVHYRVATAVSDIDNSVVPEQHTARAGGITHFSCCA